MHRHTTITLLVILFLLPTTSLAGSWTKQWDRGSETPYTVIKTNDTGVILLSKTRSDQEPMILLTPHGKINCPSGKTAKVVLSVDKTPVYTGEAIVLSGKGTPSKAYTLFPPRATIVNLMFGNRATFILAKSLSEVEFAEFQFNLEGSKDALLPLVGRNL